MTGNCMENELSCLINLRLENCEGNLLKELLLARVR